MPSPEASSTVAGKTPTELVTSGSAFDSDRHKYNIADYVARSWEGEQIFLSERIAEAAIEVACWKKLAHTSRDLPPLAGLTMTVKACFDVEGWTTSCASAVLENSAAATRSASLVTRLRSAGATLVAQTNMTEFAYGALGVNSRFGTPRTPLDPVGERVSGGSSSGAAVAVARNYCDFSLCSDTSGSARIPAAFCGVVGFKPSRHRYPTDGLKWLSPSFDVPGFIASSVALCSRLDRIVTGRCVTPSGPVLVRTLRFVIPSWLGDFQLDDDVRRAFDRCIAVLLECGVAVEEQPLDVLPLSSRIASEGRMIAAEAYQLHRTNLEDFFQDYDRLVGPRLLKGAEVPAYLYLDAVQGLARAQDQFDRDMLGYDAFLLPTAPIVPPRLIDLEAEPEYLATNAKSFSLTEFANRLDLPSISLPIGPFPFGLMLTGTRGDDDRLLSIAEVIEPLIQNINVPVQL